MSIVDGIRVRQRFDREEGYSFETLPPAEEEFITPVGRWIGSQSAGHAAYPTLDELRKLLVKALSLNVSVVAIRGTLPRIDTWRISDLDDRERLIVSEKIKQILAGGGP